MTASPVSPFSLLSISFPLQFPESTEKTTVPTNTKPHAEKNSGSTEDSFLKIAGYEIDCKVTDTLQGCLYRALKKNPDSSFTSVIIKQTSKSLHMRRLAKNHETGEMHVVDENIIKEAKIMMIIKNKMSKIGNAVNSVVEILDFLETNTDYYLVMEDGGQNMFDFIVDAHQKINNNKLRISKWRKYVKYILWQLCVCLRWLHSSDVRCCHLDISLENLLISGAKWKMDPNDHGYYILAGNICLKLCDFGLAEIFNSPEPQEFMEENTVQKSEIMIDFGCSKYCGKLDYISPEIVSRQSSFQANKSDIWSLGVVFFAMTVGHMPYKHPNVEKDCCYQYVVDGKLFELLHIWKCLSFVSRDLLHLMTNMLDVEESDRFTMDQVIAHPWFHCYFSAYFTQNIVEK